MTKNAYEDMHAGENGDGLMKDMDHALVMMNSPFSAEFVDDDIKQGQMMMNIGGREILFERDAAVVQENLLDDEVNDPSMFYSCDDFPLLPDFSCMSSSSSSSSTQLPSKTSIASGSSSSSASSSSATSWTVYSDRKNQQPQSEAVVSSTACMEFLPPPDDDDFNRDIDCINAMENLGYMDLLDNSADILDPCPIFESEIPQEFQEKKPAQHQEHTLQDQMKEPSEESGNEGNDNQIYVLQGNGELAVIFLEWLKQNKDYISAQDMRNITLKRSTIECASKRLGSTNEGKKQLLKLILEWVGQYQLQKKCATEPPCETINPNPNLNCISVPHPDPNTCFFPPPWIPPAPPCAPECATHLVPGVAFPPTVAGDVRDPFSNVAAPNGTVDGNIYHPPSECQSVDVDSPRSCRNAIVDQYNRFPDASNLPVSGSQALYGNPSRLQVFDGNGGERLVRLSSSATKEARKKRMARQRRFSSHQYRHHNPSQDLMTEQHARINVGEDCTPPPANQGSWIYLSPPAPAVVPPLPPASAVAPSASPVEGKHAKATQPVDRGQVQSQNHQRQAPTERKQVWKTEKNLKFLLQKVLKQSDVGNLGRIVLPKKEAQTHLPELESRDGIPIAMEDIGTSNVWNMRYRFWPNNKSRMYLLENTGDFVRVNGLQEGDFIVIYSDTKWGKYLIRGVKVRQPGSKSEGKKPARRNQHNVPQAAAANSFSLASFKQTVK